MYKDFGGPVLVHRLYMRKSGPAQHELINVDKS